MFPLAVKQAWIVFFLEAYIELLISNIIAFKMLEIRKVWNAWDKFSVACHFVGIVTVIGFYLFICHFVFIKAQPLIIKHKLEKKEHHRQKIKEADELIRETQRKNENTAKNSMVSENVSQAASSQSTTT